MQLPKPVKPAVLLWIQTKHVLKMSQGVMPPSWYLTEPESTNEPFVQVVVPLDTFALMHDELERLKRSTEDLPF